jgi:hypothetical protein
MRIRTRVGWRGLLAAELALLGGLGGVGALGVHLMGADAMGGAFLPPRGHHCPYDLDFTTDPQGRPTFSSTQRQRAQEAAFDIARDLGIDAHTAGNCHDDTGVVVGIAGRDYWRGAELARAIEAATGVPAMVRVDEPVTLNRAPTDPGRARPATPTAEQ